MKINVIPNLKMIDKDFFVFNLFPQIEIVSIDKSLIISLAWLIILVTIFVDWKETR